MRVGVEVYEFCLGVFFHFHYNSTFCFREDVFRYIYFSVYNKLEEGKHEDASVHLLLLRIA